MKVLHINCHDAGSTGKIIGDISEYLHQGGHQSYLICPKITVAEHESLKKYGVCFNKEQGIYKRISWLLGLQYGFAPLSTQRIIKLIEKIEPDIIHLHSANCNMVNLYKLFAFMKRKRVPVLVTNHAEFFYTGSCAHSKECDRWLSGCGNCPVLFEATESKFLDRSHTAWQKMKASFSGLSRCKIVSVSPWVYDRSVQSPILEGIPQTVIKNGVDIDVFYPQITAGELRSQLGISSDKKIVLYVTSGFDVRTDSYKSGKYLLDLAERFENDDVVFIVAGRCETGAETYLNQHRNIKYVGVIKNQVELSKYYSMADICLLTSKRETFSMPVAESMCCGTPVVGFEAGGPESIALKEYSSFVKFGDTDELESILRNKWLAYKSKINMNEMIEAAQNEYSGNLMAKKYMGVYEEMLS